MDLIEDRYNGITIDSNTIPNDIDIFKKELLDIISKSKDKNLLWINLSITKSSFIPYLARLGFIFYCCNNSNILMLKKLILNPTIPTASNHTLGVGAVVIYNCKLLVIKDKIRRSFKLPGGYIDDSENISNALEREVLEETGVKVKMETIVSIRMNRVKCGMKKVI